jgi:hypothetical protein
MAGLPYFYWGERFYVYDNQSRISCGVTLADYIHRGWVIVTDITGKANAIGGV